MKNSQGFSAFQWEESRKTYLTEALLKLAKKEYDYPKSFTKIWGLYEESIAKFYCEIFNLVFVDVNYSAGNYMGRISDCIPHRGRQLNRYAQ